MEQKNPHFYTYIVYNLPNKHNVFTSKLVTEAAKNNATQHDSTKVGCGNEGSNKLAVAADQAPLIKRKMKIMHAVSY